MRKDQISKGGAQNPLPTILLWETKYSVKTNFKLIFIWRLLLRNSRYDDNLIQNQKRISTYRKKCTEQRFYNH